MIIIVWKCNFTVAHYSIFAVHGSPKKIPVAAYATSTAPMRMPMRYVKYNVHVKSFPSGLIFSQFSLKTNSFNNLIRN